MASEMRVTDVELACDTIECGYRIVELEDGRHAFVWGNIRAHIGDVLPDEMIDCGRSDRGIEVHDTYEDAESAWKDCAEALCQTGEPAGREMLAVLS